MKTQVCGSIWLNDADVCSIEHLAEVSGLTIEEIDDLVASGIISPVDQDAQPRFFQLSHVVTVRTARRLRDDFQLNRGSVALALALLRRIDQLESELTTAQVKCKQTIARRM